MCVTDSGYKLVLAGSKKNYGSSEIQSYVKDNKLERSVILTGYVRVENLVALYNLCDLFVLSSFYEGFGVPLLEAMATETPIVASKISAAKEIAGRAAEYYSDPQDKDALAEALLRVLHNQKLRATLITKGLERVKDFSWKKVAERHLKAYKRVLKDQ